MKSTGYARLKSLIVLPVILIIAVSFAVSEGCTKTSQDESPLNSNTMYAASSKNDSTVVGEMKEQEGEKTYAFTDIDVAPVFPGGEKELQMFIMNNVQYPAQARKDGITGKVFVQFVIAENGKVQNAKITKSVHPLLDAEVLRIIGIMPDWLPGKTGGKAVKVELILPVNFQLS